MPTPVPTTPKSARTVLTLLGVLAVLGTGAFTVYAAVVAPKSAKVTLTTTRSSRTVAQGATVKYPVRISRKHFGGRVKLRVTNRLPAGVTATFTGPTSSKRICSYTPASRLGARAAAFRHRACWYPTSRTQTRATLTVRTTGKTPVGTHRLRLRAVGFAGTPKTDITVTLVVTAPAGVGGQGNVTGFTLTPNPTSRTVDAGSSATFPLAIVRTNLLTPITFTVTSALPDGVTASFAPSTTAGLLSTLTLTTDAVNTPDGTYPVTIRAAAGPIVVTATITLVVSTPSTPFPIAGNVTGLAPGVTRDIDLSLTNSNSFPIAVSTMGVAFDGVTGPEITPALPCGSIDFEITQYSGTSPLVLPPGTHTLSELGVASAQWPHITMINRPVSQDGCQRASVALKYTGAARRAS